MAYVFLSYCEPGSAYRMTTHHAPLILRLDVLDPLGYHIMGADIYGIIIYGVNNTPFWSR
jgi:hypothetical protein